MSLCYLLITGHNLFSWKQLLTSSTVLNPVIPTVTFSLPMKRRRSRCARRENGGDRTDETVDDDHGLSLEQQLWSSTSTAHSFFSRCPGLPNHLRYSYTFWRSIYHLHVSFGSWTSSPATHTSFVGSLNHSDTYFQPYQPSRYIVVARQILYPCGSTTMFDKLLG